MYLVNGGGGSVLLPILFIKFTQMKQSTLSLDRMLPTKTWGMHPWEFFVIPTPSVEIVQGGTQCYKAYSSSQCYTNYGKYCGPHHPSFSHTSYFRDNSWGAHLFSNPQYLATQVYIMDHTKLLDIVFTIVCILSSNLTCQIQFHYLQKKLIFYVLNIYYLIVSCHTQISMMMIVS